MIENVVQPMRQFAAQRASRDAAHILRLSAQGNWQATILGQAPVPQKVVRLQKWVLVPAEQDCSSIPDRAQERVQQIYEAGLRPRGFVIIHEAPALLPAGPAPQHEERQAALPAMTALPRQLAIAGATAAAAILLAPLIIKLVVAALTALVAALIAPVLLVGLAGAVLVDPMLVAVTEDGYWIVIDRWYT